MDAEAIDNAVRRLARELDRDYADRPPALVGVLKGGFIFLADLVRRMQVSVLRDCHEIISSIEQRNAG